MVLECFQDLVNGQLVNFLVSNFNLRQSNLLHSVFSSPKDGDKKPEEDDLKIVKEYDKDLYNELKEKEFYPNRERNQEESFTNILSSFSSTHSKKKNEDKNVFDKGNGIFKTVSREQREKVMDPKTNSVAVGQYRPNYNFNE